jgi:hypothetical protein
VPAGTISKADLLLTFARAYERPDIAIENVSAGTIVDRTLATTQPALNEALWKSAGFERPPTVPQMIEELAAFDYRAVSA